MAEGRKRFLLRNENIFNEFYERKTQKVKFQFLIIILVCLLQLQLISQEDTYDTTSHVLHSQILVRNLP